jgi:HK97 family phage prohead protease
MSKILEYKQFFTEIKAVEEDNDFYFLKGMVSPYDGKPDLGGDIIEEGAYRRTIDQKGSQRTLLWSHDIKEPIGTIDLTESKSGLETLKSKVAKGVQRGKEAGILVGMGAVKGFSIGYQAVKVAYKDGNRILKEIALHEVSVVAFPMNEGSNITGIKSQIVGGSMSDALNYVLQSLESATSKDVEVITQAVSQFNNLLVKFQKADPSSSTKKEDDEKLIKEIDNKLVLDFKNFLKENLK